MEKSKKQPFLRDYQMDAVKKMKNGCILNGGVGSGKSRTALYYYFKEHGGKIENKNYTAMINPKDLYIITTARKRDTLEWENELIPYLMSIHPESNKYNNLADLYCTHSATCLNIPEDENYKLSIQKIR